MVYNAFRSGTFSFFNIAVWKNHPIRGQWEKMTQSGISGLSEFAHELDVPSMPDNILDNTPSKRKKLVIKQKGYKRKGLKILKR